MTRYGRTFRGARQLAGGYVIVLFAVILAFVGIAAAMQVLVLTSVATTSRAFDAYRQSTSELRRLERAVAEALYDAAQISVEPSTVPLTTALQDRISVLAGPDVTATTIPAALPAVVTFPDFMGPPDPLQHRGADLADYLTPELSLLLGGQVAAYPEARFEFASDKTVFEARHTHRIEVCARLVAVPLSRFPITAYDLPKEIGDGALQVSAGPRAQLRTALAPSRDPAFSGALQAQAGVLPYHYRRRAAVSAAYQYVFSQAYIDRVAEYAGITHYCQLDAVAGTAELGGLSKSGATATWDLGVAGAGTYGSVSLTRDAAVVFSEAAGHQLRLCDSAGSENGPAMLLLLLGPSNAAHGRLRVEIASIGRPVVIVGYNVELSAAAGTSVHGAILLDPHSAIAPGTVLALGHLSYWAGSAAIPNNAVTSLPMPPAAEVLAPRVLYVATKGGRL